MGSEMCIRDRFKPVQQRSYGIKPLHMKYVILAFLKRVEEQNREEGEMAQKELGGGRNRWKK